MAEKISEAAAVLDEITHELPGVRKKGIRSVSWNTLPMR